jgi:eukaryotic-like serine/threonine-protein kinase
MSLAVDARIGPYEVIGTLGADGMGEVYRARDSPLARDVALKVLPAFSVKLRFSRRSSIPTSARFTGSRRVRLPPSPRLRRTRKPDATYVRSSWSWWKATPLRTASIAGRFPSTRRSPSPGRSPKRSRPAEADPYVHRDGHRDEHRNVGAGFSRPDATASPTITSPVAMTGAGTILGTAAYMAPEQAKGRAADKRSDYLGDIWISATMTARSTVNWMPTIHMKWRSIL